MARDMARTWQTRWGFQRLHRHLLLRCYPYDGAVIYFTSHFKERCHVTCLDCARGSLSSESPLFQNAKLIRWLLEMSRSQRPYSVSGFFVVWWFFAFTANNELISTSDGGLRPQWMSFDTAERASGDGFSLCDQHTFRDIGIRAGDIIKTT